MRLWLKLKSERTLTRTCSEVPNNYRVHGIRKLYDKNCIPIPTATAICWSRRRYPRYLRLPRVAAASGEAPVRFEEQRGKLQRVPSIIYKLFIVLRNEERIHTTMPRLDIMILMRAESFLCCIRILKTPLAVVVNRR